MSATRTDRGDNTGSTWTETCTWRISVLPAKLQRKYTSVHRDPNCVQFTRIAYSAALPSEWIRYFPPCDFCVHDRSDRWHTSEETPPRELYRWYALAHEAKGDPTDEAAAQERRERCAAELRATEKSLAEVDAALEAHQ